MDNRQHHYLSRFEFHKPWLWFVGAMVVSALVAIGGLVFDDRIINGAPAWEKPLKFSLSFILYGSTLAVLLPMLRKGKRFGWWLGTILVAGSAIEMAAIVGQAARGHASHFNLATETDANIFALMGFTVVVIWLATFTVGVLLWRNTIGDKALTWAIRLSMPIAMGGLSVGALMTTPKPGQLDGDKVDIVGAHTVGAPDGGPELPILGWSTTHGDLRIAHFLGMHAMQVLPLLALGLAYWATRNRRLANGATRLRLVAVSAIGYTGLSGLVLWQALRGEPIASPGALTLAGLAALAFVVAAGVAWAVRVPAVARVEPDLVKVS